MQKSGILRIGTSGIVVPGNKQTIPPGYRDKSRLRYYASLFNTLEVNSSFKKLPMHSTFEKWSADVPLPFQFTIKMSHLVTHVKPLSFDPGNINSFITAANGIGEKKGCILLQFPASIKNECHPKLEKILKHIDKLDGQRAWRKAIEIRSTSWHNSRTVKLLQNFGATMVLQDMAKSNSLEVQDATDFAYFRYHGPKGDYRGSYDEDFLQAQAQKMRSLLSEGKDVYAYFNNTMGNAFENAVRLRAMVEEGGEVADDYL
jgi:uncharacterized protein YecE (DUF72 family)